MGKAASNPQSAFHNPQSAVRSAIHNPQFLVLVAAAVLLAASAAMAEKKVLIVSVDGCRPDALQIAAAPNINALIAAGSVSYDARNTLQYGESGPNYSSMLTGTWLKHGVTSNNYNSGVEGQEFPGNHFDVWHHMFAYLEAANPSLYTAQFVGWEPINRGTWADHCANETGALGDSGNANRIKTLLTAGDPDVIFWQISAVDSAGHSAPGFTPTSAAYLNAIAAADSYYGTVLTALRNRPGYIDGSEEWLILTVTDHGGYGTSHHLPTSSPEHDLEIQRTFFVTTGTGVGVGADIGQPRVYDVAVTAMEYMGLDTSGLNLDGAAVLPRPVTAWRLDRGGNATAPDNWTASVPDGAGHTAVFGPAITTARTVTLNIPVAYGAVTFDNQSNYTIGGSSTLTLKAAGSGAATMTVLQSGAGGGHVISAPLALASPLEVNVAAGAALTFSGPLGAASGGNILTKSGDGTLTVAGPQDYGPGAVFTILGGAVFMNTDAGSDAAANLSISVTDAVLNFGFGQHLDTLTIGEGGEVAFGGDYLVVLKHLVISGVDLGPTTLTPEPATLSLLALGAIAVLRRRHR